jgi:hypothetical protein
MTQHLFDVDPSFYDDCSTSPFYRDLDEGEDFDFIVAHWKRVGKELTYSQILLTIGDNHADDHPIPLALRPLLDKHSNAMQKQERDLEIMEVWASSTEGQLRSMVKRRTKNKNALDYIKDPEKFLKEVAEFKRTHPKRKQWPSRKAGGVKVRQLFPPADARVVARSATSPTLHE